MLQVKLRSISNATAAGEALAARAVSTLQEIVNDPRFLAEVRAMGFTYTARMVDSGQIVPSTDNDTIVQLISGGKEVTQPPDGVIDLTVVIRKFSWFYRNTMGSVVPPDPTISTNRSFFYGWVQEGDAVSLAAHWMHEWMHAAGFYHRTSSGEPKDVPYAVGEIAVRIGQSLAGSEIAALEGRAPGASYLQAAKEEKACISMPDGAPADLVDDSPDAGEGDEPAE